MNLVLLSGGSGKRLWPLSNDARSKQFLKVLKDPDGNLESMVQRVWRQLEQVELAQSTVIATSSTQVDMIQNQILNQPPIIIEPERRDTFPAIALAASYMYSIQGVGLDEVLGVLPVDPYVEDDFFKRVSMLEDTLKVTGADLALMGVSPTYPSSKYGYIVPTKEADINYITVSHFKEKPTEEDAEELISDGALWNCGVFAFKLRYIIQLLEKMEYPIQFDELKKQYTTLPKDSFDYQVVENANKIVALPYEGYWKDLGTWNTLTEEMGTELIGRGIKCKNSLNTHIVNELDIPITVLGISNTVVAASPDGILVTDKPSSPQIKSLLNGFEQRPMYEERRWGWYKVLDHTKYDNGDEVLTKRIGLTPGKNISYQKHSLRSEIWTVIRGEGVFVLNDQMRTVRPGDVLEIPPESRHGLKAVSELEFIEVQSGKELIEEDIVRIYMKWEDLEAHCYQIHK